MKSYRVSREEKFNRSNHYGKIINEYKEKKERSEGPRNIAIKMYKEGKTLEEIVTFLKFFKEEIIIGWLVEEFPIGEIKKYYIECEKQKIADNKQKKGEER